MWDHSRVLRCVLLMTSLLAFSGLHQQQEQPSIGWRVARLLPLSLGLAFVTANTASIVSAASSAPELVHSLAIGMFLFHVVLLLPYLLCHRRRLHDMLRKVAELEQATILHRRPRDHTVVKLQSALLLCLIINGAIFGTLGFFLQENPSHPRYVIPSLMPPPLQSPPWYWIVNGLQALFIIMLTSVTASFDVLLSGLADAVALFQARLVRYCQQLLGENEGREDYPGDASERDHLRAGNGAHSPMILLDHAVQTGIMSGRDDASRRGQVSPWITDRPKMKRSRIGSSFSPDLLLEPSSKHQTALLDIELQLNHLKRTYLSVRRLATDAAAFCSFPTLSLHACVTSNVLLHSYISIIMFNLSAATFSGRYNFFLSGSAVALLRLLTVSCAGSRLIQQGQQLHQTLAEVNWPAQMTTSARFSLQLLLEQTRQPAVFDAWGLFSIQKRNMLSLISFVLTYFVIMVQLEVE